MYIYIYMDIVARSDILAEKKYISPIYLTDKFRINVKRQNTVIMLFIKHLLLQYNFLDNLETRVQSVDLRR